MEGVSFDDAGETRGDGDSMLYADHIFWAGDLNYRINMGHGGTLDEFNRVKKLAIEGKLQPLIACDQLRREMTAGRVFPGWVEAEIDFRPSYRMERGVDMYNNKKNQNPSYCDRVLWRSLPGFVDHVEPLAYESHMDMMQSDHRPVSATFKVRTKVCFVNVRPVKHVDLRGYCQLAFSDVTLEGAPEIDYAAALAEAEDQSGFGTCRMCGKVLNDKSKTVDAHAQKAINSLLYCNATCERRAKALGTDESHSDDAGKKKKKKKKLGGKKVLGMLLGNAKKVSSAAAAGAKAIKAAGDGAGNAVRVIYLYVTFRSNPAHNLTRSPVHIFDTSSAQKGAARLDEGRQGSFHGRRRWARQLCSGERRRGRRGGRPGVARVFCRRLLGRRESKCARAVR